MKINLVATILILSFSAGALADCGKALNDLWFTSFQTGAISAIVPETPGASELLGTKWKELAALENESMATSVQECSVSQEEADKISCLDAIIKLSSVSYGVGYALSVANYYESRPDFGQQYVNTKTSVLQKCAKK